MVANTINHQWHLAAHPEGLLRTTDFVLHEVAIPALKPGQVLVRTIYLSIDPSARLRIDKQPTYSSPLAPGALVPGRAIGVVEQSTDPRFQTGDLVQGDLGWQRYAVSPGDGLLQLANDGSVPLTAYFALLGHIGLTAYVGLLDIGKPQPGETLVVSAAAGAVGSIVGQLGKIAGCRVVGIVRGADKCRWLTDELGFDAAIDATAEEPLGTQLRRHCPDGIDIGFENVGGPMLDAVLEQINLHARIVLCGLIGQYNVVEPVPGPYNFANLLTKRARVEGFLNFDHPDRAAIANEDLARWLREGRLRYKVEIMEGFAQAPLALDRLFTGGHLGKLVVKVSDEPRI